MAKKRKALVVKMESYGLYAKWSNRCKELPKFLKFTDTIPLRIESEFGFILQVKGAKGLSVDYVVEHPKIVGENGKFMPTFTGEIPIRDNDSRVYVGDTLWEPLSDKMGVWRVVAKIDGYVYGDKSFTVLDDTSLHKELIDANAQNHLWKR